MLEKIIIPMIVCCILFSGCLSDQKVGNGSFNTPLPTSTVTVPASVPATSGPGPSSPITMKFNLTKIPVVNEETTLIADVNCVFDAPDTNFSFILPSNVVVIQGITEKKLDLKANNPEKIEVMIKFTQPGNYKITARARKVIDQDNSWGDMKVMYLSIGNTVSSVTTYEPTTTGELSLPNTGSNNKT